MAHGNGCCWWRAAAPRLPPPAPHGAQVPPHHHPAKGRRRQSMAAEQGAARPSGARLPAPRAVSPPPPALPPHHIAPRNPAGIPLWGQPCAPLKARRSAAHKPRDRQARSAIPRHLLAATGTPARRPAPLPWPRHGRAPRRPAHWYRKAQSRHDQVRPPVPPIPRDAKRHPERKNWTALLPPHSRALSWQIALHHPAPARMAKPEPFAGSELHAVIIPRRRQRAAMPPFRFQP